MINNLRKHLLFIYTVAVIFIVFSRPLNIFASNDSVLSDSVQVGTYTVGDNVTAKVEKEGNIYVLYFKSDEGTLWADWRSKLGHWVKNIDIIKFSTDSSKMILPANSSYLFGSNPNHNEEWALESLDQIDLEKANTSFVTNMTGMFANCENLKVLNLIGFNTVNVKKMASMFDGCRTLTSVNLNSFNTSNTKDMYLMFFNCRSLTSVDVSSFDTSKVEHMYEMFSGCRSLETLDLKNFNTVSVENMSGMFSNCSSLTDLDLSNFNTTSVRNMSYMFSDCTSLINLNLAGFDTVLLNDMYKMFYDCSSLTTLDLSSFDTSNVYSMYEMFSGCSSLETLKTPEKNAVETDLPATMYDENDQEYHTLPILEKSIDLVKRTSIEKASVAGVSLSYGYTRKAYTPDLTVKVNGTELVEGTDYTVKYENNIKPGTATITITGIGTYTGTRIKKFEIVECASDLVSGRTYLIIPKNESSTAVCALSGRMVNDTTVYITNRSKSEAMRFKAVKNSDGTWKFINAKCELALAVRKNSSELGAGVVLYDQTDREEQNWKLSKRFDNSYALINAVTGYSIELSDASALKGTSLSMQEQKSSGLQRFYFVETDEVNSEFDGTYVLRSAKDKKYALTVSSSSKQDGANVELDTYADTDAFKFKVMHSGGGYYRLVNVNSGLVVTVRGNTKNKGADIIQSTWKGLEGQRWHITENSGNTVTLMNALGTVLQINGDEIREGISVSAGGLTGAKGQSWYLK